MDFKNVVQGRIGLLPPEFFCSHKHFLYEPGPVSLGLLLQETAHVGTCGKGKRFLLFSGQDSPGLDLFSWRSFY